MGLELPPVNDWLGFAVAYHGDPAQPGGHATDEEGTYIVPATLTGDLIAQSASLGEVSCGTAYLQHSTTSCMRGAVATALQIPYTEVPEMTTTDQDVEVREFAVARGYEPEAVICALDAPAEIAAPRDDFWIGTVMNGPRSADSHAVLLRGHTIVFDPAWALQRLNGWPKHTYDIQVGTKFTKKEDSR